MVVVRDEVMSWARIHRSALTVDEDVVGPFQADTVAERFESRKIANSQAAHEPSERSAGPEVGRETTVDARINPRPPEAATPGALGNRR